MVLFSRLASRVALRANPHPPLDGTVPRLLFAATERMAVFGHQRQGARAAAEPLQQDGTGHGPTRRPTGERRTNRWSTARMIRCEAGWLVS